MKKCKGCGISLQNINPDKPGYVVDLNQDYCRRCFRLSHYGDVNQFNNEQVTNEKIFSIYSKYQNELFVLIIDVLDALVLGKDSLFDIFSNKDVFLIINKTDLLPENVTFSKIERTFSKILFDLNNKYSNIKACLLTNKFENQFNNQFFNILDELKYQRIIFAGCANAGKSSLINKLLGANSLTTSLYPGTTLDEVIINYKNYTFIDTPGLIDVNSYATYLSLEKYKLSKIDKTIKPQIFQVYEDQSYFYEGLLRVDVLNTNKASISFYINNENKIHRTKYLNADNYYDLHYHEFKLKVKPLVINDYEIDGYKLFVVKGLGYFKINGKCNIKIHSLNSVKLYTSEVNL